MKTLVAKDEQFLTDAKGKRTGVVLDLQTYDALHDRAHVEIAAGQFSTLASYRASRGRKSK